MDVRQRISVFTVILRTWKYQLRVLVTVTLATVVYREILFPRFQVSLAVVTVLGTAIAFFIGFINSQAYGRWWEARKIWGSFVNDSRSFSRMVMSFLTAPQPGQPGELQELRQGLIHRHLAFMNAVVARLRDQTRDDYTRYLTQADSEAIRGQSHVPNAILGLQGQVIDRAERAGYSDVFRMAQINEMLNRFSDSMGKSERIKLTVFPALYSALIRMSIWIFLAVFPMVISETVGYWAILFGWLLGWIFLLTYLAGQALLNPFENRRPDVPISSITRTIEINLLEQLGEKAPEPLAPIKGEYLL